MKAKLMVVAGTTSLTLPEFKNPSKNPSEGNGLNIFRDP